MKKIKKIKNKKHHSLTHKLSSFLFYFILCLVLFISLSIWLTDTPEGFKTLITLSKPYLAHKNIKISGKVSGVLNHFELEKINIHGLAIQDINIQIRLRDLFKQEFYLKNLSGVILFNSYQAPIHLSGTYALTLIHTSSAQQGHALNFQGELNLNKLSQPILKLKFQMAGTDQHYQLSAQGPGNLLSHSGHLIIQGLGSGTEFHTEELKFKLQKGDLEGGLNLKLTNPWEFKLKLQGQNIPLQEQELDPNNFLNFDLNFTANSNNQTGLLKLHSGQWDAQINLDRNNQTGLTHLQPIKIQTPTGSWSLPETQFVLQPDLINFPETCLNYLPATRTHLALNYLSKNSLSTPALSPAISPEPSSDPSNHHQTLPKICGSFLFQNQNSNTSSPLIADLSIQLPDLDLLQDFLPELSDLSGSLSGNIHIDGPLSKLLYTSNLELKNGQIGFPSQGLIFENIQAQISSHESSHLNLTVHGNSGQGDFLVKGAISYEHSMINMALGINGNDITLMNLPLAHITGSPHLIYTQNPSAMALTGSIQINSADIHADQYQQYLSVGIKESPDVLLVNNQDQPIVQNKTLPFALNIILIGDKNINFQGFGLNTQITGHLNINSFADQPSFANGILNLNQGEYQAYGKHFKITQGRLIFNHSPLNNPNLDITALYQLTNIMTGSGAQTSTNNLTIGIKVSGTLQKIHLALFSNPSMSQENILSYIITGQPLSQMGPASQSALSQAALSLASGGDNQTVLNSIQDKLKLNQLTIGSLNNLPSNNLSTDRQANNPDQDNTAVFIGKAITPRFFVSYGVGLFNSEQIFMTHFKLSKHFYLQTDNSNLDSGADIFYTFEH